MLSMKKLVPSLAEIGFENAVAYLQSGNLIFNCDDEKELVVEEKLRDHLKETFEMTIPVVVRSASALRRTIDGIPFPFEEGVPNVLHVFLMSVEPSEDRLAKLDYSRSPGDSICVHRSDIYLKVVERSSDSKFTNDYFERTLKVTSTARNWKTIKAIEKLLEDREL